MAEEYLYGKYDRPRCHGRRGPVISRRTRILSCRRPFKRRRGVHRPRRRLGLRPLRPPIPLCLRGRRARYSPVHRGTVPNGRASGRRPAPLVAPLPARHPRCEYEYELWLVCPGITLEGPNASEVWNPQESYKNDDSDDTTQHIGADQKLIIKMVSGATFRRNVDRDVAVAPRTRGPSPPAVHVSASFGDIAISLFPCLVAVECFAREASIASPEGSFSPIERGFSPR